MCALYYTSSGLHGLDFIYSSQSREKNTQILCQSIPFANCCQTTYYVVFYRNLINQPNPTAPAFSLHIYFPPFSVCSTVLLPGLSFQLFPMYITFPFSQWPCSVSTASLKAFAGPLCTLGRGYFYPPKYTLRYCLISESFPTSQFLCV